MSLNGIYKVTFISTGLKLSKLERCWKKIMKLQKSRVTPIDLKKKFTEIIRF